MEDGREGGGGGEKKKNIEKRKYILCIFFLALGEKTKCRIAGGPELKGSGEFSRCWRTVTVTVTE